MGFFSKLFRETKELTKLGNAVANVKNMLDEYEIDPDRTFLLVSAWICKVAIIDKIAENNWAPNSTVYVPINGNHTRMYMTEVQMSTIGRLKKKVINYDPSLEHTIDDILNGGKSFYDIEREIPQKQKDLIL